jgi:phosphatidylserine/phosphatidylglycerophosphate/cardiolipin synthase-like enzyme
MKTLLLRIALTLAVAAPVAPAVAASDIQVGFSPGGSAESLVMRTLESARQSIRLLGYSFTSPEIVRTLIAAKRRGVDVAVAADYKSNLEEDQSGKGRAALAALVNAGIPTRVVRAFSLQHSKFFILDGQTVETGSYNFTYIG